MENYQTPLNNIRQQVEQLVQQHHSQIVIEVYKWLLKRHSEKGCICDYCLRVRAYTQAKLELHRFKKWMEADMYFNSYHFSRDDEKFSAMKRAVVRMRQDKNSLKLID